MSRAILELHLGVLVSGTASMCISMCLVGLSRVDEPRSAPPGPYFNKERRCPDVALVFLGLHLGVLVLEILQEIEWQIGDFCEDGNARVTEDSNQYGRSFTRLL